jgi:hypothetical protein
LVNSISTCGSFSSHGKSFSKIKIWKYFTTSRIFTNYPLPITCINAKILN